MSSAGLSRPPVYRITLAQLGLLLPVCLVLYRFNPVMAQSALAGGAIAVIPQAWFASRVFRFRGARSAQAIARSSYSGEIGKFMLTAAGFAAVFATLRPLHGPAVFGGYLAMLAIQVVGSWWLLRQPNTRQQN